MNKKAIKDASKMADILTPKEVQKKYGWSYSTWRRRREECQISPYKDAIVIESQRRCHVKAKRFEEFQEWKSQKLYNEQFGLA
ncbi:hypothetical protein [Lactobacillus gasseri]|uniref:hypothetical protein n=1 Tax=Lactobacillus gasseri TaxID=1596 RepID=UPI00204FA580|nr:hypothetical protein [Lactobacillus gasseri]MCZ9726864.1 hypothetical protein [Lactobacillus gasseri]MDX5065797.1 hypothetical protein [Lactobacillus gasseri]MDX5082498.1 hypothetical protein [Lactobacillus gasseri]DAV22946.1 MAG TPA: chaperone-modulator protein [Caudoviricetes sp.]